MTVQFRNEPGKMTWRQDGHETSAQSRFMISCVNSVEKKDHLLFSFTQRLKELFFCFELAIFICLAMSPLIVLAGYVVIYEIFCMDQY